MGLFKTRGSRSDTKGVLIPFSMSRRLSNIAEEDGGSDVKSFDGGDKHKKTNPKGTPNRSKTTPTRRKQRFQKLEEWDYGTDDVEPYEPPQDFLSIQKTRQDLFYERGPEKSKVVKVSKSTLNRVLRSNGKNQGENSSLKLFQFASDTASLSKSCSTDSSSAGASLKRSIREDDSVNKSAPNKIQRIQNAPKAPKLSKTRSNGRSLFHNRAAAPDNRKPKLAQHPQEKPETEFEAFAPAADEETSSAFGGSDWPKNVTFHDDNATQTSELTGSTVHDVFRAPHGNAGFKPFPALGGSNGNRELPPFQVQSQDDTNKVLSSRAKALVEKSKAILKDNRAFFQRTGTGSPIVDFNLGNGNCSSKWPEASPFELTESPFKENENVLFNASIFRSKNTSLSKSDRQHASPMVKTPPKPESRAQSKKTLTPGRVLTVRDNRVDTHVQSTKDHHIVPQPQNASRPHVSFRFDNENLQGHVKPAKAEKKDDFPAERHTRRNPQRNVFADRVGNIGALPQLSPNSMHLFMDKASSFDSLSKKESFASTIDSSESNSTATSVSTFADASPRGIRGSFPNHLATTSSLSTSTASTNLLNEANVYKPSRMQGGSRPPTGVPPTTILGSMLFQAGDQDVNSSSRRSGSASTKTFSPKRVPHSINAKDEAAISDVTGSTASDWMIQGNKLLSRYYHNDGGSSSGHSKKDRLSRRLRVRESQNSEDYEKMMAGIQKERRRQAKSPE